MVLIVVVMLTCMFKRNIEWKASESDEHLLMETVSTVSGWVGVLVVELMVLLTAAVVTPLAY